MSIFFFSRSHDSAQGIGSRPQSFQVIVVSSQSIMYGTNEIFKGIDRGT